VYADIKGPFKAFTSVVMNDNTEEMQFVCPAFFFILLGIGTFSLRASDLIDSFSYWWVTFPLMVAPVFLLGWSYQVSRGCENILDVVFGASILIFLTFPLVSFVALLTLYLDGNSDISPVDVMIPVLIMECSFLLVLCGLFSNSGIRRRHLPAFSSFCVVIPLIIFQVLLSVRTEQGWNYGVAFIPIFIGEVAILLLGCSWTAKELNVIPEDIMMCIEDFQSAEASVLE